MGRCSLLVGLRPKSQFLDHWKFLSRQCYNFSVKIQVNILVIVLIRFSNRDSKDAQGRVEFFMLRDAECAIGFRLPFQRVPKRLALFLSVQEAVLSPFPVSLHTYYLMSCHCGLLKHTSHVFIRTSNGAGWQPLSPSGIDSQTWTYQKQKQSCWMPLLFPPLHSRSSFLTFELYRAITLSGVSGVRCFSSYLFWWTYINSVFTKRLKLSFFIPWLRNLNFHLSLLWRI